MTTPADTIDDLLRKAHRTALHLEMRDNYAGTAPDFYAWLDGRPLDRDAGDVEWHAVIGPPIMRGVDVRRARIVSEPISDYIRFEHEVTPATNLAVGERVRWVPRRRVSTLALPGNDFWLVDDVILFLHFSGDGALVGTELAQDPAVVNLCRSAFEAAWERGIDHSDYDLNDPSAAVD